MDTHVAPGDQIPTTMLPEESPLRSGDVARLVDQHLSAQWRGDEDADHPFFRWLASCWRSGIEQEPRSTPLAISVLAAGGVGIRWFETPGSILGFIPGRAEGYYLVSRTARPPEVSRLHTDAGTPRQRPTPAGVQRLRV